MSNSLYLGRKTGRRQQVYAVFSAVVFYLPRSVPRTDRKVVPPAPCVPELSLRNVFFFFGDFRSRRLRHGHPKFVHRLRIATRRIYKWIRPANGKARVALNFVRPSGRFRFHLTEPRVGGYRKCTAKCHARRSVRRTESGKEKKKKRFPKTCATIPSRSFVGQSARAIVAKRRVGR